jgi:hypothetical protein
LSELFRIKNFLADESLKTDNSPPRLQGQVLAESFKKVWFSLADIGWRVLVIVLFAVF